MKESSPRWHRFKERIGIPSKVSKSQKSRSIPSTNGHSPIVSAVADKEPFQEIVPVTSEVIGQQQSAQGQSQSSGPHYIEEHSSPPSQFVHDQEDSRSGRLAISNDGNAPVPSDGLQDPQPAPLDAALQPSPSPVPSVASESVSQGTQHTTSTEALRMQTAQPVSNADSPTHSGKITFSPQPPPRPRSTQSALRSTPSYGAQRDWSDHHARPPARVWTDRSQESEPDSAHPHKDMLSISETLDCDIKVFTPLDNAPRRARTTVRWLKLYEYRNVLRKAESLSEERLFREYGSDYEQKKIFPVDGRVYVFRVEDGQELASEELLYEHHWNEHVPRLVGRCGDANPFKTLRLEVVWKVDFVSIIDRKGDNLSESVFDAMDEKLKKYENVNGERFLPQKELDAIFDQKVVTGLICEDETLSKNIEAWQMGPSKLPSGKSKQEFFVDEVWRNAPRLLATCLFTDKPCTCLFKLIKEDKRDVDLPLTEAQIPSDASSYEFRSFWSAQKQFSVFQFDKNSKLGSDLVIPEGKVVPVMFKSRDPLGRGGFGEVFEVTIHRQHHNFDMVSAPHVWKSLRLTESIANICSKTPIRDV